MNLYKYKEILENINIIVIFSIPIISLILYTLNKRKVMILENLIYIGEFFIYLYLNSYIIIGNINLISVILILKFVIILTLKEKLKINNFLYKFILILGLLYVCNIKVEYSILINIILNIIILKCSIIDCIKLFNKELLDNRHDLNQKKSYIKEVKKKIKSEKELQKNYKDEILGVSNKISKSIEESDIPIFILDINKEFIYSNEAFNMLIQDYKNKENRIDISKYLQFKFPKYKNLMDEIKKIATEARGNLNIKSYDGKIYRLECITDIIDERPVIVCILKDITQTTLIQNKLEESENMYKNLMDVLNEGVIIHDNKNIKYINDKGLEILDINIGKKEIFIEDIKNIVSKKFREKFLSNIQLVISRKEEKVINKIELINGRIVELVTTNIKLNDEDLLISIVIDITELENTIMNIEQSEKTYKLLLQTLPEGIVIVNPTTKKHIYRNEASIRMLKTIGLEKLNESIKTYLKEENYGNFRRFTIDKLNNVDISLAIVKREEEGSLIVVFRMLDCEFKSIQLEKELNRIKEKNKFKTEFLSNVAYDIKKPINKIFETNNNLIENKGKYNSENINNHTRLVKQNCYRLIRLLSNVEYVSRIDNGTCTLELRKCDIVKLVENIVKISKTYTDKKGIDISFKSEVNKKILSLDIDKVEKIILNILSNAIKFTDTGGRIDINLYMENEQVCISIKDTGIGIPKDKTEVIFENFEQLDTTLSRGCEGTGMGLSVVKKLANLNNIKINVESELNKGSEFIITLPNNIVSKNIKLQDKFAQDEKIDIEFSDIYLNLTS
ncbi:MAG: HAMP domain-containing sensor histidine kinase [Romboutsia timonensis]|uniref:PAS domain-containing sensor histidine kinase n=1 Tax=Romboutsia timonensis TaxID=1776391 RepID=UPI002A74C331|nr:HAMP domain-containing sensor histidine kinase [Romboutsia timonensis]MDY2883294.1 HAMP domain-containing sensor histidine kinase [Romboutsia timonensis]